MKEITFSQSCFACLLARFRQGAEGRDHGHGRCSDVEQRSSVLELGSSDAHVHGLVPASINSSTGGNFQRQTDGRNTSCHQRRKVGLTDHSSAWEFYLTGGLPCLKQHGFFDLPMITISILTEPVALAHIYMERRSLAFMSFVFLAVFRSPNGTRYVRLGRSLKKSPVHRRPRCSRSGTSRTPTGSFIRPLQCPWDQGCRSL